MPPLAGPWDTLEEERRLDACRPWTTVRRKSLAQLLPNNWAVVISTKGRIGILRRR